MTRDEFLERTSARDFSGSEDDSYLQTIYSFWLTMISRKQEQEFFELLEKADKEGKKLSVVYDEDTTRSEFDISEIFMV